MKPITDDMVFSLLRGLEEREKDALYERAQNLRAGNRNRMAARITDFTRAIGKGGVISLDAARAARRESETVRGLFSYAARL